MVPSDQATLGDSLLFRSACASAPHQQGHLKGDKAIGGPIDWDAIRRSLSPIQWQVLVPGAAAPQTAQPSFFPGGTVPAAAQISTPQGMHPKGCPAGCGVENNPFGAGMAPTAGMSQNQPDP